MRPRPVLLAALALAALPRPATAAPALAFEDRAVVLSGATPQGQVVWFSLAKQIEGYMAHFVTRQDLLGDTDGAGVVRFELDRTVPLQSLWVAVDLASGEVVVGTPDGFPLRDASEPAGRGSGEPGLLDWSKDGHALLALLVVRPGLGAWTLALSDGGENDEDHALDGRITATLARLRAVGSSPPPPESFQANDLVFAIDPDRMEILAERIPAAEAP